MRETAEELYKVIDEKEELCEWVSHSQAYQLFDRTVRAKSRREYEGTVWLKKRADGDRRSTTIEYYHKPGEKEPEEPCEEFIINLSP